MYMGISLWNRIFRME